ncbi:MAG: endonuclease domain-containing protein [Clostridia bacterium]|nr:endonuclease domain-containing protein [Clostridia bacterium]
MSLPYKAKNIGIAKNLRKNATPQERHLWYDFLSSYRPRFQRQKAIGDFIADFFCHEAKLVIELDGSQHYTEQGIKKDSFRTEKLEEQGLLVLHISNSDIKDNFRGVCEYINMIASERVKNSPSFAKAQQPPRGGGQSGNETSTSR